MHHASVAADGGAPRPGSARSAAAPGYEAAFCADDLPALRRAAAEHGRLAGLSPGRLRDFVLAVNEVATSAVCHGSGRARLRLWVAGDDMCCEVRGRTPMAARQPSGRPDDTDSLRLWVVGQICREVRLSYGPGETTVLVSMGIR
jgi:serine/threonine-protein kinase RsbW